MSEEKLPKYWCSVVESDASHDEMFSAMAEVLREMGINCERDDEIAEERGVDLFIVFTKIEENNNECNSK